MRCAALATLLLLGACDRYPALREADAARDAQQFIAAGDCRFVSVYGVAEETPGVTLEDQITRGARPIEGTSDTPASQAEIRFNERARRYAERYNQEILAYCR
jgi:hypothetical protein